MCSIVNGPVDVFVRAEEREWKQTATEGNGWKEERRGQIERETRKGRLNGGCTREGDNRGVGPGG